MNNQDTITSKQLIFIIIGAQIGMGLFSLPRLISETGKQDAWIAALLGGLLPLLILVIIDSLGRRLPKAGFVAMNQRLFGSWLGSVMVVLFIAYIIFFEATVIRMFTEITMAFLLPRTPLPVITFTVILTIIYAMNKGARVIGRLNEALFWINIPLFFLTMLALYNADLTNILPMGEVGFKAIASGTLSSATAYAGIEILLVFYFLVGRKEEVIKAGILGVSWTILVYVSTTIVCLLVWGSSSMQMINWPVLTLLKTLSFPVLERPEVVLLATWIAIGIRPALNMGFAAAYSLNELLNLKGKKHFFWITIIIILPIYAVSLLPANLIIAFKWSTYAGQAFLAAGLFYPLLMLIIALIREEGIKDA